MKFYKYELRTPKKLTEKEIERILKATYRNPYAEIELKDKKVN